MFLKKQPISQKIYNKIHKISSKAKNIRCLNKRSCENHSQKNNLYNEKNDIFKKIEKNNLNQKLQGILKFLKINDFDNIIELRERIPTQKDYKKIIMTCIFLIIKNMIINQKENLNEFKKFLKKDKIWDYKFKKILNDFNDYSNYDYIKIKIEIFFLCSEIFFYRFNHDEKLKNKCGILYDLITEGRIISTKYKNNNNKFIRKCMEKICLCLNFKNQVYCVNNIDGKDFKIKSCKLNIINKEKMNSPLISLIEKNKISFFLLSRLSLKKNDEFEINKNKKTMKNVTIKINNTNNDETNLNMKETSIENKRVFKNENEIKKDETHFLNPDLDFSVLVLSMPNNKTDKNAIVTKKSKFGNFFQKKNLKNVLNNIFKKHQNYTERLMNLKNPTSKIKNNFSIRKNRNISNKNKITKDGNYLKKNEYNIQNIKSFRMSKKDKLAFKEERRRKNLTAGEIFLKNNNLHLKKNNNIEYFIKKRLKSKSKSIRNDKFSYLFSIRSKSKEYTKSIKKRAFKNVKKFF